MTKLAVLFALAAALAAPAALGEEIRASELLGQPVLGSRGERLGRIVALRLDVRPGGIHYAELAATGGAAQERYPYPVNALRRGERGLELNVPAARLEQMPAPDLELGRRFVPAREVLGRRMDDPLGNRAGRVADVALDLETGRTRYFVVQFVERGEKLALPPHHVRLQPAGNPVLQADRARRS